MITDWFFLLTTDIFLIAALVLLSIVIIPILLMEFITKIIMPIRTDSAVSVYVFIQVYKRLITQT